MFRDKRKTKIVATLGPSSDSQGMITRLIQAGTDVFRLNFSHGDHAQKRELIALIRAAADETGKQVAILADLQGPKIRTGKMAGGSQPLEKGQEIIITTVPQLGQNGVIPTIYEALPQDVSVGSRILLDDGLLELKVTGIDGQNVHGVVVVGGLLKDNKGINLPGVAVSAPSLTEKDQADLDFALMAGVDYIALSFVRTAEDLEQVKRLIYQQGSQTPIIAKIEKPEALRNFKKILAVADGIMVARGDLGVEIQPEKVPVYQKRIIQACNKAGKPVITATQMLESMVRNPRPTRAETSDVANAILDGTDAVMLSAETASGEYPLEAVETMVRVALDVETAGLHIRRRDDRVSATPSIAQALAEAACRAAVSLNAKAIAVFTASGSTAALLSRFRPPLPIIAFSASKEIQRRLSLYAGITTLSIGIMEDMKQQLGAVESILLNSGYRKGDIVVVVMGMPVEARGSTNLMKVHKLGTGRYFEIY